jgi:serine kinase of HPr protein (carbohydrate metabolism regulator)
MNMDNATAAEHFIHGNALVLGETGLLILGPSGAGKSTLTLSLLARTAAHGDFARLVGDDRISVAACNGRIIARPHPAIEGLIETRGLGIQRCPFEPACIVTAVVEIVETAPARLPEPGELLGQLANQKTPWLRILAGDPSAETKIVQFIHKVKQN